MAAEVPADPAWPAKETDLEAEHQRDAALLRPGELQKKYASTYSCWKNLRYDRPKSEGAQVAPEFVTFAGFLHHMGPRPGPEYTVDRIDNSNPTYGPELCRWATKKQQARNRSSTRRIKDPETGEIMSLPDWAEQHRFSAKNVRRWLDDGLTFREIVGQDGALAEGSTPPRDWSAYLAKATERQLLEFCPIDHLPLPPEGKEYLRQQYAAEKSALGPTGPNTVVKWTCTFLQTLSHNRRCRVEDDLAGELENAREGLVGSRTEEEIEKDLRDATEDWQRVRPSESVMDEIAKAWDSRFLALKEMKERSKRRKAPQRRRPYRDPESAWVDDCEGGYIDFDDD